MTNKHKVNKKGTLRGKDNLNQIFHLLQGKTYIDFSEYKPTTVNRRIQRRMMLHEITSLKKYVDYLRSNHDEVNKLQKDLLINVTQFFRDPEKFDALAKVVFPEILTRKSNKEPIKIWIPGCSTGEEAYSIAMLLSEFLRNKPSIPIQIFATDINHDVIDKAREGLYPHSISGHISSSRLKQFFTKVDNGYLVNKDIRENCIFAVHDLAQNPPFANVDLISCQNVLIYLNPDLQKKIVSIFHYALTPNGFLILGNSEGIGIEKNYFHVVDTKHKIYSKKLVTSHVSQQNSLNTPEKTKESIVGLKQKITKRNMNRTQVKNFSLVSRVEKITRLKEALELSREYANVIVDELNSLTEELQSSNEELQVNNEELQATNEELEAAQEELHAANDELLNLNSKLQKREQALARLAAIVESSDDAIISKDREGIITSWNKGAQRLFGYKAQEIIGKSVELLIPIGKKNDFPKIMNQLLKGKRVEHYETQRLTKDKRILDVSLTVSPLKDAKGKIIGASKIARDITERKLTENNLRFLSDASQILSSSLDYKTTLASVAKLAVTTLADWCTVDLLDNNGTPELVAVAHKDPRQVKWAKAYRKEHPVYMQAPTGLPNVLRTGKSELYPEITDKMLVEGATNEKELALLRKLAFNSVMVVPISQGRQTIGAITFVSTQSNRHYTNHDRDFAEELAKRAGIAIENARLYREAQKAINLRNDFISLASHELKTPITSFKMYALALKKQFEKKGDTSLLLYFAKMNEQTNKLTHLVNDLLNISKIRHGKLEFNMEQIDLNQVVKDTVDTLKETTKKHTILIEGSIKKRVYADQHRMYQVLTNLLSNAIKYSPQGDKIIVRLTQGKDEAVVTVQDFGIGIDSDQQKKIFGQFYRVTNSEEKTYPGLGMGLYIANEIIKRHGGKMNVVSNKGKGSEFSFALPYTFQQNKTEKKRLKASFFSET